MLVNALKILRGTVIAQFVGFLALPFFARLFTPDAFGVLQLFQALMGIFLVVASMRYEIAILRASDGSELSTTLQLCCAINFGMALLVALGCYLTAIAPLELAAPTFALLWWLPAGVLVGGALQTLGYLALRQNAFSVVGNAKVGQALGAVAISTGFGLLSHGSTGLAVGDLSGRFVSAAIMAFDRTVATHRALVICSIADLVAVAKKFREFPTVSVPGGLINAAGGTMTSIMMFAVFDTATAGQFGLVERSIILPVAMVAAAVSQVFTADFSAALRDSSRASPLMLFRKVVCRMFMLGIGPAVLVGVLGPLGFERIFGSSWAQAGIFARAMSPLVLVIMVSTAVNMTLMLMGYQKIQLCWELSRLVLMLLAWFFLSATGVSAFWAVNVHVSIIILTSLIYLALADFLLRRHSRLKKA